MDKDGVVRTLPLFSDFDTCTQQYTFSHPNGLLFAIQFAQIAPVVAEKAAFEDMQLKGFIQKNADFASHSLGECPALSPLAGALPISSLVDVVFYCGISAGEMGRGFQNRSTNRRRIAWEGGTARSVCVEDPTLNPLKPKARSAGSSLSWPRSCLAGTVRTLLHIHYPWSTRS